MLLSAYNSDLISGNEAIKIAIAGIGKPLNEVTCSSSVLKIARRSAPNTGIRNAKNGSMNKLFG